MLEALRCYTVGPQLQEKGFKRENTSVCHTLGTMQLQIVYPEINLQIVKVHKEGKEKKRKHGNMQPGFLLVVQSPNQSNCWLGVHV